MMIESRPMTTRKTDAAGTETGPKRFNLVKPYEFRGTRYDMLVAREPKVRDLRAFLHNADADPILAVEKVLSDLTQVDQPVIGEMSIKDFGIMKKWFEDFLGDLVPNSAE